MKYLFQRGKGRVSVPADTTLFHFGTSPGLSVDPCYSCHWLDPEPQVTLTHGSVQLAIPLEKIDESTYSFSHAAFGMVYLVKCPWYQARPAIRAADGVTMSFQGWDQGIWYDGIYSCQRAGRLTDIILPGAAFQVQFGDNKRCSAPANVDDWFAGERFFAQKQSLIHAARERWGSSLSGETVLAVEEGSAEEILSLLLFRLAFLAANFVLVPKDEGLKRLAQNLNIMTQRSLDPNRPSLAMAIDWGSSSAVHELLRWQLNKSPFIPGRLWARLVGKI